jgi:hypothetical protein
VTELRSRQIGPRSRSQRRDRINEARATWAGATEDCLSAWENDQRSFAQLQAGKIELSERMERVYFLEDTKARLRAATVRLVLIDPSHSDDPLAIEAAILEIERAGSDTPAHRLARAIRLRLREVVDRWIRRKAAAPTVRESGRPGAGALPPPAA